MSCLPNTTQLGVSENWLVPHCTHWFCWSLSLLNGYFIGNIPYFQTNPFTQHYPTRSCRYCIVLQAPRKLRCANKSGLVQKFAVLEGPAESSSVLTPPHVTSAYQCWERLHCQYGSMSLSASKCIRKNRWSVGQLSHLYTVFDCNILVNYYIS